jgi:membrane protein YdbS with pleckstrin-like domain
MESHVATHAPRVRTRRSARAVAVWSLGPVTVVAGMVWAIFQPYRLTLLDPGGEGFWWLAVQPPLLVMLVGVLFHLLVAPPLVRDLEEAHAG